ncbi:sulfatase-like hydrolase/transferase [bacterium]|nr:sulfatase-like hydrolase/transferase [bacterium]
MAKSRAINRRQFQRVLGLGALSGLAAQTSWSKASKPNLVLIMADDLGYECIGANGCAEYNTPHLDRLAETGARFTNCHVNPLCTPTRVAIMTGRYNFRNYTRFGHLQAGEKTFAHMLKKAGYATCAVGKWQLGNGTAQDQSPRMAGFDEYCLWNVTIDEMKAKNERFADANLIYWDREKATPAFNQFKGEYGPKICKDYLVDFMTQSAREEKPFFAYFPMILTHWPFKPTPNSPAWEKGKRHQEDGHYFKDMVEYMDTLIGDIVTQLDRLGVRENTLFMFVGDNGTHKSIQTTMKDGSLVTGAKSFLTDEGTHVPFIANMPGAIPKQQIIEDLVDPTDFMATMADCAQVALPKPPQNGKLDGVSFWPQLQGKPGNPRDWILIEYFEDRKIFKGQEGRFVRDRRWKLYDSGHSSLGGEAFYKAGQLYDMKNDPAEKNPVGSNAGDRGAQAARERLGRVLRKHRL